MRTKSRWKRSSGLAAAGLALGATLLVACQPSPPEEPRGKAFAITGVVDGLYPGVTKPLWLTVANAENQTVSVRSLTVMVGTPNRNGCPASALLASNYDGPPVLVKARSRSYVQVPVELAANAPQACQGATFPFTYRGVAVKPGTDLK